MMDNKNRQIPLAKNGHREVSSFVGQELLYDYLAGQLDPVRREALEKHIKLSREAQSDIEKMQHAMSYLDQMSRTLVSQAVVDEISEPTTYVSELFKKTRFEKWPTGVKWGLEALLIVGVIVAILIVVPWDRMMDVVPGKGAEGIILAEVDRNGGADKDPSESAESEFQDEGIAKPTSPLEVTQEAQKEIEQQKKLAEAQRLAQEKALVTKDASAKKVDVAATNPTKVADLKAQNLPKGIPEAQSGGFLFRGDVAITNLDAGVPKLTSKIESLGGRKAGDVSLGWRKGPSSAYFHFTIPAAKYGELATFMSQFGKLRLSKEKHPRVMPDGIIRLIVTVEEAKQ